MVREKTLRAPPPTLRGAMIFFEKNEMCSELSEMARTLVKKFNKKMPLTMMLTKTTTSAMMTVWGGEDLGFLRAQTC
jgi:hypothetical protein